MRTIPRRRTLPFTAIALLTGMPGAAALAADPPLKVTSPQAAKGTSQVVVGAFNVGFIFESVDNSKATGGMIGAFGGTTKAKSELVGVTPQMMQAITDAAYADFKAQLAARGFTVADSAGVFADPEVARHKPLTAPYEGKIALEKKSNGKATFYKPAALDQMLMYPGDIVASGLSGMGTNMAIGQMGYGLQMHAKASGQSVVTVVYLIDFSNLKRPGAFSISGLKVSSGMSVVGDYSKLNLVAPSGKTATITVKQPIAVEGDFADMADTTKGAGVQKAANILSGVSGALGAFGGGGGLGGMKFGKSKTYTFTAKAGIYEEGATKAATLANTRMVEQLAALR